MNKEQQDKIWSELSEEKQKSAREMYKQITKPLNPAKSNAQNETDIMSFALETTFGSHNLNPKPLTHEDVAKELFGENNEKQYGTFCCPVFSEVHCDKISAINALINVAKYLNGDWKPDWSDREQEKFFIGIDNTNNEELIIKRCWFTQYEIVYFCTEKLAQQAIQILGKETIRLALTTDY